jgi:hypothetical protein
MIVKYGPRKGRGALETALISDSLHILRKRDVDGRYFTRKPEKSCSKFHSVLLDSSKTLDSPVFLDFSEIDINAMLQVSRSLATVL